MQSDHKEIEVNTAKLLSKKIVDAAKIKDEKSISAALSQVCINIQYATEGAPAYQLAVEGNIDAVNFLRDKFNASLAWIICGYARGGHIIEANKILDQAENPADRLQLIKTITKVMDKSAFSNERRALQTLQSSIHNFNPCLHQN